MKILAVTDEIVERLYSLATSGHFADVSLILACGDLPYTYLEYLVTVLNVPLAYVPGNHDPQYDPRFTSTRAEGCENLDGRVLRLCGLTIAGLGGSPRYHPHGTNQYSESEMMLRVLRLAASLFWLRLVHGQQLDILITHSPPYGIHDENTRAHRGLRAINQFIKWTRPRLHLHGHIHFQRRNLVAAATLLGRTKIINVFPYQVIEIES